LALRVHAFVRTHDNPVQRALLPQAAADDPIRILLHLFAGRPAKLACEDAADIDDDGVLGLTDAIAALDHLFRGGPAPPAPSADCGSDPTSDALGCATPPGCAG